MKNKTGKLPIKVDGFRILEYILVFTESKATHDADYGQTDTVFAVSCDEGRSPRISRQVCLFWTAV